jgi:TrmH family RNA methyltransferase
MDEHIGSRRNPRIVRLVQLRKAEVRRQLGLFLIEGRRECRRAVESAVEILEFYRSSKALICDCLPKSPSCKFFTVADAVFEKISARENPDGLLAVARIPDCNLPKSLPENALVVIAEAMEKPGNLGALLRSVEAAGCNLLIVADPLTDIWNPNAVRASQGAIFAVPIAVCSNCVAFEFLSREKIPIVGSSPSASTCYWDAIPLGPVALAVGNEHSGLSDFWLKNATLSVRIPMEGNTSDSLNAATAAALCLYEILRVRNQAQVRQP